MVVAVVEKINKKKLETKLKLANTFYSSTSNKNNDKLATKFKLITQFFNKNQ